MGNLFTYLIRNAWKFSLVILLLNFLVFGRSYISDTYIFIVGTIGTTLITIFATQCYRWVLTTLRSRFPGGRNLFPRLITTLVLFVLMTAVLLTFLFYGYDFIPGLGYEFDEYTYNSSVAASVILIIFGCIVLEGRSSFIKWKTTLTETEQLKKEHMHSQLLGLRSQVSPHFLFNSLNSLSSLIIDDPQRAELFLDEMSKVYRYLLRNSEELVELGLELNFLHSYFYLLKTRYGAGVQLCLSVDDNYATKLLPPLTLQTILDNIFRENLISKQKPLNVNIRTDESGWLEISHNVQKRISETLMSDNLGMVNITNKFRLLSRHNIRIDESDGYRYLHVPLIDAEQISVA